MLECRCVVQEGPVGLGFVDDSAPLIGKDSSFQRSRTGQEFVLSCENLGGLLPSPRLFDAHVGKGRSLTDNTD